MNLTNVEIIEAIHQFSFNRKKVNEHVTAALSNAKFSNNDMYFHGIAGYKTLIGFVYDVKLEVREYNNSTDEELLLMHYLTGDKDYQKVIAIRNYLKLNNLS